MDETKPKEPGFGDKITAGIQSQVTGNTVYPDAQIVNQTLGAIGGVPLDPDKAKAVGKVKGYQIGLGLAKDVTGLVQGGQQIVQNQQTIESNALNIELQKATQQTQIDKAKADAQVAVMKAKQIQITQALETSFTTALGSDDVNVQKTALLDPKYSKVRIGESIAPIVRERAEYLDSLGLLNEQERSQIRAGQTAAGFLSKQPAAEGITKSMSGLRGQFDIGSVVEGLQKQGISDREIVSSIRPATAEEVQAQKDRTGADISSDPNGAAVVVPSYDKQGNRTERVVGLKKESVDALEKARAAFAFAEDQGILEKPGTSRTAGGKQAQPAGVQSRTLTPGGSAAPSNGALSGLPARPLNQQVRIKDAAPAAGGVAKNGNNGFGSSPIRPTDYSAIQSGQSTQPPQGVPEKGTTSDPRALLQSAELKTVKQSSSDGLYQTRFDAPSFEGDPNAQKAVAVMTKLDEDTARGVQSSIDTILRLAPRPEVGLGGTIAGTLGLGTPSSTQQSLNETRSLERAKTEVAKASAAQDFMERKVKDPQFEDKWMASYLSDVRTYKENLLAQRGIEYPADRGLDAIGNLLPFKSVEEYYYTKNYGTFNTRVETAVNTVRNVAQQKLGQPTAADNRFTENNEKLRTLAGNSSIPIQTPVSGQTPSVGGAGVASQKKNLVQ